MKTKILSIAMAMAIAIAGFNAAAQKETRGKGPKKDRKECVQAACQKDDKQCARPSEECGKAQRPGCKMDRFLEGITLSSEQQTKVDAMKQKNKAEFDKKQKERMKEVEKQRQEEQKQMDKRMVKLQKEMKEILTPEQYQIFETNVSNAKAERKEFKTGKPGKGTKGAMKKGNHKGKAGKGKAGKFENKADNSSAERPADNTTK